jgi:hypothetical protein
MNRAGVAAYCCDLEERGKEIGVGVGDKNEGGNEAGWTDAEVGSVIGNDASDVGEDAVYIDGK